MKLPLASSFLMATLLTACQSTDKTDTTKAAFQLITLDPGHFHAALVQKNDVPGC